MVRLATTLQSATYVLAVVEHESLDAIAQDCALVNYLESRQGNTLRGKRLRRRRSG